MILGILKDTKVGENRVILIPSDAKSLIAAGHRVYVEKDAGKTAGFSNEDYEAIGAKILETKEEVYEKSNMIAKVKEIEAHEYPLLRDDLMVYTCIHPASHPDEVQALLKSGCTSFTAEDAHRYGSPNCEAAGKAGAIIGLYYLMNTQGGKGVFPSGLGAAPGMKVLILGGGNVGKGALQVLHNIGAWCTVADINIGTLRDINQLYKGGVHTVLSSQERIEEIIGEMDLVLNCVKWPKGTKKYLVTREMVASMEENSVLVDISNDEEGAIETFRETTHENPIYKEEGVIHYCVSNIPGAIAKTTSVAYSASVIPHFLNLFNNGMKEACIRDGYLRRAMCTYKGFLTHEETSAIQNIPWVSPENILGINNESLDPAPPATVSRSKNYYKEELWKK